MRASHLVSASALAGIGFTVSLFVTDLAFESEALRDEAKVGVLAASALAAAAGLGAVPHHRRPRARQSTREAHLDPPADARTDHLRGPAEAPHTLVEFGDYSCPHTRAAEPELARLRERSATGPAAGVPPPAAGGRSTRTRRWPPRRRRRPGSRAGSGTCTTG